MKATFKGDKREYEFDCEFEEQNECLRLLEQIDANEIKASEAAAQLRIIVGKAASNLPQKLTLAWVFFAAKTIIGSGEEGAEAEKNGVADS